MKIFDTANLNENTMKTLSDDEASWIYNGLDCCVTAEIYNELMTQLGTEPPNVRETYHRALSKLAPIMEMSLRGTLIDEEARQKTIRELELTLHKVNRNFQRIMLEVFDTELNWRSPIQLKNLFYGMLGLKEIKKRNQKGQFVATVNGEALEHFQMYIFAKPLAKHILILRDLSKQLGFLKTQIDPDGRMRTNYNLAGTNTGRLASSMSDFGTGTNLQNVNRKLRYPFVADPGMYLVNVDLSQADGRNVGAICWNLFVDAPREQIAKMLDVPEWNGPIGPEFAGSYLDAAESGDLHTTVCRMVWPDLAWPTDDKLWAKYCDSELAHGQDSFRQLAKKGGHGTNYLGTPRTMAKHLHIISKVVEHFQKRYFDEFPCLKAWHNWVIGTIEQTGTLTTMFGRRRQFFGRGNDASTHRKAVAFEPQSCTGEQIDIGMLQVWRKFPVVQFLNQVHDSVLFQIPFNRIEELIPEVLEAMKVELTLKRGRKFVIPLDAAGGWNWGYKDKENPYGLSAWKGSEDRVRPSPKRRLKDYLK
jgi:DNA polymerase-1